MSQEQDRAAPGQEPETQPLERPSIHRLISREEAQTNDDSGNEADQSSAPSTPPMRAQSHEASPANDPRPWLPRARSVQSEGGEQRSRAQEDVASSSSAEAASSGDEAIFKLRRGSSPEASVESLSPSIPKTRTRPRNYRRTLEIPHAETESSFSPTRPSMLEYNIDEIQSLLQNLIEDQISNETARMRQDAEQQSRPNHDRRVSDDNPPAPDDQQYVWRGRNVHLVPREQIRQDLEQQQSRPNHDRRISDDNPPAPDDQQYVWRGRNVYLVPREQIRQDVELQSQPNHDRPVPDDNPPVQQYDWKGQNVYPVPPQQIRQDVEQARSKKDGHVVPEFSRSWIELFKKLRENWKTVLIFIILAALMINLIKLTHFDSKSQEMEKLPESDRHDDNDKNPTPPPPNWWGPAPPM